MTEEEKSGEEKPVLSGFEDRMRRIQNGWTPPELVGRKLTDDEYFSIYGKSRTPTPTPTPNGGRRIRIRRRQTKRRRTAKRRRVLKRRRSLKG